MRPGARARPRSIHRNQASRSSAELRPTMVMWSTARASARVDVVEHGVVELRGREFIRARQTWRDSAAIVPALTASIVRP